MSTQKRAFRPLAPSQTTAVGTSSVTINLNWNLGTRALRCYNAGADTIYINIRSDGSNPPATVAASMPMLPNSIEVFTIAQETTQIAAIGLAGGNNLITTIGEGL